MQRRDFLKLSATAGAVSCITACGSKSTESPTTEVTPPPTPENIDYSTCTSNCGLNCVLKIYSRDGVITRVESEGQAEGEDTVATTQCKACYRGRSAKQRVSDPARLKYPMKRVEGTKRGEGKFERISWDEAFALIAENLTRVKEQYSNEAIFASHSTGTFADGMQSGEEWVRRVLGCNGGYLRYHGTYSTGQLDRAAEFMYGGGQTSTVNNIEYSDMLLAFGWNPNETAMGGGGNGYQWGRISAGLKDAYFIDPRYTDSMLGKESKWVPIRPGTDAALVEAIAYLLITRGQTDEVFLEKYCIGYDKKTLPASANGKGDYKSYILGTEDGVPKTPARAAGICRVPEEMIVEIADKLAAAKTPFIHQGWLIQRQANGEQTARAIMMLPFLLGKIGIKGTGACYCDTHIMGYNTVFDAVPMAYRKVAGQIAVDGHNPITASIHCSNWEKAAELGDKFTVADFDLVTYNSENDYPETDPSKFVTSLSHGIKFIWAYANNGLITQHQDPIRTAEMLRDESKIEFIVNHDVVLTASGLYSDLVLPGTMDVEQDDMLYSISHLSDTIVAASSSIKPSFEAKSSFEVCLGVAEKLGCAEEYSEGRTQEEWFRYLWQDAQSKDSRLPDYDEMRELKFLKLEGTKHLVALEKFVEDPVANPLYTPSGKVEIYSERLANWGESKTIKDHETVTAIPVYATTAEGYDDEAVNERFPLQWVNNHGKQRVHSMFELPWTREVVEDPLWMNSKDAEARGLQSGQQVYVESLSGTILKTLRVTPRIMPGVVSMAHGGHYKMVDGIDVGGCGSTLLSNELSPIAKNIMSTNVMVEVSAAASSNAKA